MELTIGIDIACRAAHQASRADTAGRFLWSGVRFRTEAAELDALWERVPAGATVTVVMEPTRNAWVPLAAWFRRRGASVVMAPSERSADLRAYYAKRQRGSWPRRAPRWRPRAQTGLITPHWPRISPSRRASPCSSGTRSMNSANASPCSTARSIPTVSCSRHRAWSRSSRRRS